MGQHCNSAGKGVATKPDLSSQNPHYEMIRLTPESCPDLTSPHTPLVTGYRTLTPILQWFFFSLLR